MAGLPFLGFAVFFQLAAAHGPFTPKCPPGYVDHTQGKAYLWRCGEKCVGQAWADIVCHCACVLPSQCLEAKGEDTCVVEYEKTGVMPTSQPGDKDSVSTTRTIVTGGSTVGGSTGGSVGSGSASSVGGSSAATTGGSGSSGGSSGGSNGGSNGGTSGFNNVGTNGGNNGGFMQNNANNANSQGTDDDSGVSTGAIVAMVAGGVVILCVCVFFLLCVCGA